MQSIRAFVSDIFSITSSALLLSMCIQTPNPVSHEARHREAKQGDFALLLSLLLRVLTVSLDSFIASLRQSVTGRK